MLPIGRCRCEWHVCHQQWLRAANPEIKCPPFVPATKGSSPHSSMPNISKSFLPKSIFPASFVSAPRKRGMICQRMKRKIQKIAAITPKPPTLMKLFMNRSTQRTLLETWNRLGSGREWLLVAMFSSGCYWGYAQFSRGYPLGGLDRTVGQALARPTRLGIPKLDNPSLRDSLSLL